jgi:molecular chaperone DnaK
MAELNSVWQAASEEMYKNTQQAGDPGAQQQGQPGPDQGKTPDQEVTDVDFEEVK